MIKIAVVGATGYTGEMLVALLASHSSVKITSLTAKIDKPQRIQEIFPSLMGKIDMVCELPDEEKVSQLADFVFLALPHKISMRVAPAFLKNKKRVIDLSADYRLPKEVYKKWYGAEHVDISGLDEAVYGLPEIYREKIKDARLIANPGCYPTSTSLGLAPLLRSGDADTTSIIIDSKTGVTGAGRKPDVALSFGEINENLKAYKVHNHQHSPEIEEQAGAIAGSEASIVFVPHLVPMNRGILSTMYVKIKKPLSTSDVVEMYKRFYINEPFVKVLEEGAFPQIRDVQGSNFCYVGLKVDTEKGLCIIVSVIDNLIKGAAGQAIQNMNIMCGLDEKEGLCL